jgi:predicted esterase
VKAAGCAAALALVVVAATSCGGDRRPTAATTTSPGSAQRADCSPGTHSFRLRNGRRAAIHVTPPGPRPYALIVALHGAGGSPDDALYAFRGASQVPGLVIVAPASRGPTWAIFISDQDLDLESVDLAAAEGFERCRIDRSRIALGGFSDGATYALTLGIANGDLFPAIIALSPGGILADERRGAARVFVSHGSRDSVLPIARTSDAIVRQLEGAGYDVTYRRFRGGHEVAPATSAEAARWFLAGVG